MRRRFKYALAFRRGRELDCHPTVLRRSCGLKTVEEKLAVELVSLPKKINVAKMKYVWRLDFTRLKLATGLEFSNS